MKTFDKFNPVIRDIKKYFNFLFDQGYTIRYVNFKQHRMIFWNVVLESPKCIIHIFQERNDIYLNLAPLNAISIHDEIGIQDQIGIKSLVYYISKGKRFIGLYEKDFYRDRRRQFRLLADLLKEYLDQITPYFGNYEFRQNQGALLLAQKEYNDLLIKKYVDERQRREPFNRNG